MNKTKHLPLLLLLLLLSLLVCSEPPEERTVRGTVFINDSITQAYSGIKVRITNLNNSVIETTETFGPPGNLGVYSAVINSSQGDIIYVLAYNDTTWGDNLGIMGITHILLDIIMSKGRIAEPKVVITFPGNNSAFNSSDSFNVTSNITMLGDDGLFCNATILFSTQGIFLPIGSPTIDIGSLSRGSSVIVVWNLSVGNLGTTNITVQVICRNSGTWIEHPGNDTIVNISSIDNLPPEIIIYNPLNNTRRNNPLFFYYNVTDFSHILNCTLAINNITVNFSNNPVRSIVNNFSYMLTEKHNRWEINCTDNSSLKMTGSSGLFNLTLNDYPSITELSVDNPISLIGGSTKTVYCNGTAKDDDSYTDIENINATLFFYSLLPNSPDNASSHYTNTSCTLLNGAGNEIDFICTFELEYYANNGTWYCNATVIDGIDSINSSQASSVVMDILALGVTPSVINFGNLEVFQISPNDIVVNVTNYGNMMLDLNLYAYALFDNDNLSMDCNKGNISLHYQRFSLYGSQFYENMIGINNSLNPIYVPIQVPKREGGSIAESSKPIFWKLQIPEKTGGTCSGKVVFMAVPG